MPSDDFDALPPSSTPSEDRRAQPLPEPGEVSVSSTQAPEHEADPPDDADRKRPPSWVDRPPPMPSAMPQSAAASDALPIPSAGAPPTWTRLFESQSAEPPSDVLSLFDEQGDTGATSGASLPPQPVVPSDLAEADTPRYPAFDDGDYEAPSFETKAPDQSEPARLKASLGRNAAADGSVAESSPEPTRASEEPGPLGELRSLLLSPERDALERLAERVAELQDTTDELRAKDLSLVLPEAVRLRSQQDSQLAKALAPTVEETLRVSVQRDPKPIIDAIFPVIGPAIRRAVNESLSSLSSNLNRTLDHSLSPRSIGWRFEAWRTGQRFSDVVISRTLLYRVEQVFLIDRITGLPLQHVVAPDVAAQDGAVVSSMLAAIQDFVQDSFGGPDELDRLTLGEMTVLVEQGPKAILAAVVRGAPPPILRDLLQDVLETIHMEFGREMTLFDGDPAPLAPVRPLLEAALVVQVDDGGKKTSPVMLWLFALLLVLGGLWLFFTLRERHDWRTFVARLDAEPGLVVTDAERVGGTWRVRGLRDPLALDPARHLADFDVSDEDVDMRWEPYLALDADLVIQRAENLLEPPDGVIFALADDGRLLAQGRLSDPYWRADAKQQARFLPGIVGYDDSALRDVRGERFAELVRAIESTQIYFPDASDEALSTEALTTLAEQGAELMRLSAELGRPLRLRVLGYASQEGSARQNERVGQRRAERVAAALRDTGVPGPRIDAIGTGEPFLDDAERTEADRERNRVAVVRVAE